MLSKYQFELALERVAEDFYCHGAINFGKLRSGNSEENEVYFKNVAKDLREKLGCQQIILNSGDCPDSGIFGDFDYKHEDEVAWSLVEKGELLALEVVGANKQIRYIEISTSELGEIPQPVYAKFSDKGKEKHNEIRLLLNDYNNFGEFYGVEYKASESKSKKSISVASFNSTCPSSTKTKQLRLRMIHNFKASGRKLIGGLKLKSCVVELSIKFSIYYLIVNDSPEGRVSKINQVFVCDGNFFAPEMSEDDAKALSKQLYPENLNIPYDLYRVGLRYRPFFDSKTIRAKGYGLYTSWEPKIPGEERERKERELLMKEVERVQQTFSDVVDEEELNDSLVEEESVNGNDENPDNVIYLTLRDERIKKRAA